MRIEPQPDGAPEGNNASANANGNVESPAFVERVRANQQRPTAKLKPHYDFIVCGSGPPDRW
jgi:hypothetical protein